MSVEKNPNGTGYRVRWRDSAGKQRAKTVQRQTDAFALDGEMKRKRAMGELVTHDKGRIRCSAFYESWRSQYAAPTLSPRTLSNYDQLWNKHVAPALGHVELRHLTPETVAALMASLSRSLAPASSRKALAILQGVLQRAVEWGYITTNVAAGVRKPRLVQREGRALTPEQVDALCRELDLRSATIVRVLAGTGLRPGELRALRWGDIDRGILVNKAVSGNQVGPTKTNRKRIVEFRPGIHAALRAWHVASGQPMYTVLVFPGKDGKLWTDQGWKMWQRQVFRPAAARAGLTGVVPYDLRHTFASTLIAEGRDIYWVARQLGHSPTMTLSTYGHLFEAGYQERPGKLREVVG